MIDWIFVLLVYLLPGAVIFCIMRSWVVEYGNGKKIPFEIISILVLASMYVLVALSRFLASIISYFS